MDVAGLLVLLGLSLLLGMASYYWLVVRRETAVFRPPSAPSPVATPTVTPSSANHEQPEESPQPAMSESTAPQPPSLLMLDAYFPEQVALHQPFDLTLSIRPADLAALDEAAFLASQAAIAGEDEAPAQGFMRLQLTVRSAACDNASDDSTLLLLKSGQRIEPVSFSLIPREEEAFGVTISLANLRSERLVGGTELALTAVQSAVAEAKMQIVEQPLGDDFLPEMLSFAHKKQLAEALLACGCLNESRQRQIVVENLPVNIQTKIGRFANPKTAIDNILAICINKKTGLYHLLEVVRYYEGESSARWGVEEVLANIYG